MPEHPDATSYGHGWVRPRPDGHKARCGGPGLCRECQRERARMEEMNGTAPIATPERTLMESRPIRLPPRPMPEATISVHVFAGTAPLGHLPPPAGWPAAPYYRCIMRHPIHAGPHVPERVELELGLDPRTADYCLIVRDDDVAKLAQVPGFVAADPGER